MAGQVTHFEIRGEDGAKLMDFYRDLFGWEIDANNPMQYGMVAGHTGGIGGGVTGVQPGQPTGVTVYIEVPDVAAALQQAVAKGGKVVMEATPLPMGDMVIGLFADPQGNVIGLAKEGAM